jgi:hypothetical protein
MSTIIKEPFGPRKHHFIADHIAVRNVSSLYRSLKRSALGIDNLEDASLEDLCMRALLVFLLFTTLLLPWLIL